MLYEQNGTLLWYGTPDAPAPEGAILAASNGRTSVVVNVGIRPISPRTSVELRYRLNGGASFKVPATLARTDIAGNAQYFSAATPEFRVGDKVEYLAVALSPGKQVPNQVAVSSYSSAFHVESAKSMAAPNLSAAISASRSAVGPRQPARQLSGQLKGTANDPTTYNACHIEAYFDELTTPLQSLGSSPQASTASGPTESAVLPGSQSMHTPVRVSAISDATGRFTLALPPVEAIASESVRFVASSPLGRVIGQKEMPAAQIGDSITIEVQAFAPTTLSKPSPPPHQATRRIRGRIIERNGKPLPANLQVLLLGREDGANKDAPLSPILVSKADSAGYFLGEVPNSKFSLVVAVIGGVTEESPVRLEDSLLPASVPVVIELPTSAGQKSNPGCNCSDGSIPRTPSQQNITESPGTFSADLGTGQCIKFNVPNRAIEEFNFYSVVRTTQPDIVGITTGTHSKPSAIGVAPPRIGQAPPIPAPVHSESIVVSAPPAHAGMATHAAAITVAPPPVAQASRIPGSIHSESVVVSAAPTHTGIATHAAAASLQQALSTLRSVNATKVDFHSLRGVPHPPGRVPLNRSTPVDWDSTPTFYEAASIAHGHLLHFKQVWFADGYSLGDLLYSLPLAPGQKKLISVVDWERREQTSREEVTSSDDRLQASLSRDRDVHEVVSGALSEAAKGGSRNTTQGVGAGTGQAGNGSYQQYSFGGLVGVSGGVGESDSSAFQDSARNLSGSSLQTLRDRTLQSASAVRNLRSTIVQTSREGETVRATTEVVANHNHCHAITIQYFEVLRHFKMTHELADVQECLFVPFPMSEFDGQKVLRWRQPLSTYLQRRELAPAFDATRRVETHWSEVDTPAARYADELVTAIFGELTVTILIPLPPFPEKPKKKPEDVATDTASAVGKALNPTEGFFGVVLAIASGGASLLAGAATSAATDVAKASAQGARAMAESLLNEPTAEERYARFQQEVMPAAAAGFVDQLELYALMGAREVQLAGADFTLVSNYEPGKPLLVSVRGRITNPVSRADISSLIVKCSAPLPPGCRAIVNSASLRYQTRRFRHDLVNDSRVNDDIDLPIVAYTDAPPIPHPPTLPIPFVAPTPPPGFPTNWTPIPGMTPIRAGKGATLYTPLDEWEQRSPRTEDVRLSAELIDHLNANFEFYHHAIWWTMDPNRRYMLLDGFVAPNADGRSVASVVDNTLIGIVGNALIMPVARGNHLDPQFRLADGATLLEHYNPQSPAPPSRVSLPTRGVFAEAVMGDCNSCEEIDDTRFWRWEESPIDEPPPLDPSAIASRRSEPNYGTPTPFPTPIISMQNAPTAPDPTGLKAAFDTLSKQSFADITGLAGTQANAAAAYSKALDTALQFGKEASTLTQQASMNKNIGQTMRAIDNAEAGKKIKPEDATSLRTSALEKLVGQTGGSVKASDVTERLGVIKNATADGSIDPNVAKVLNQSVLRSYVGDSDQPPAERAAAAKLIDELPRNLVTSVETAETKVKTAADSIVGSGGSDFDQLEIKFANEFPGMMSKLPGLWVDSEGFALWNFGVDSSDLKRFRGVLDNFGSYFTDFRDRGYNVDIVGSASASGSDSHNMDLSFARAVAVSNLYQRQFNMDASRLNVRQVGSQLSVPPSDILEQEEFQKYDDEVIRRAWNRRVELYPVAAEPWTEDVFDRIYAFLDNPTAPVRNDVERNKAKLLSKLLKNATTDDLYVTSFQELANCIRGFWNQGTIYNTWLQTPGEWHRFTFASHMRDDLSKAVQPTVTDQLLATRLLEILRAMQQASSDLARYIDIQQSGGSGAAINVTYQIVYEWIRKQITNENSVYSAL